MTNNLVTKDYLDKRLYELKTDYLEKRLLKLKKEITSDLIDFMDSSVVPLLKSMDKKLDDLNDLVNKHEHRLDKHDDKFLTQDRKIKKLFDICN